MARFVRSRSVVGVLTVLLSASVACGQGGWSIGFPFQNQQFLKTTNISGTGGAPEGGLNYVFYITDGNGTVTYQTTTGVSYDYMGTIRWTAVCPAPSGGYPVGAARATLYWGASLFKNITFVDP